MRSLNASHFISNTGGLGSSLPNDQWKIELKRWMSVSLAAIQILVTDYAIGPGARTSGFDIPPPTRKGYSELCKAQKMRKPGGFMYVWS